MSKQLPIPSSTGERKTTSSILKARWLCSMYRSEEERKK